MNPLDQIELKLRAEALNHRKEALDELATYPAATAIPILQKLAQEKDFGLRRLAVMGLGNHRTDESFQILQQMLAQEKDANVLSEVANSLFEFGDAAIPLLPKLFNRSANWLVRQTVISLLVETSEYEALFTVAAEALQDETQTVKEAGILALSHVWRSPFQTQAFDLITQLAVDPYWRNRWRAAIALQGCQHPQAKPLLLQLQQDEHFRVVAAALEMINYNG